MTRTRIYNMIWDEHFIFGCEKDLDDVCNDIIEKVITPVVAKSNEEIIKKFIFKVESHIAYDNEDEKYTKRELLLLLSEVAKEQFQITITE